MEEESYAFQSFILHVPFISFWKVQRYLLMKCNTSGTEPGTKQINAWQHNVCVFKKTDERKRRSESSTDRAA